jgi:hypothetical protein
VAACARLLAQRLPEHVAAEALCALDGAGVLLDAQPDGAEVLITATAVSGDTAGVSITNPEQRIALGDEQPLDVHVHHVDARVAAGDVQLRLHRELPVDRTHVRHVALLAAVPIVDDGAPPPGRDAEGWQTVVIPPPADPLDDPAARLDLMPWGWLDTEKTHFHIAARLYTGTDQDVLLHLPFAIGSAQLRVWLDGTPLEGRTEPLLDHTDEHVFAAHLTPGTHEVLVRMVHPQYMNFFALRVSAPDGSPAHDVCARSMAGEAVA